MSGANAIALAPRSSIPEIHEGFSFSGFRIFTSVPDHPDIGIVALQGMVVVYDERPLHREPIVAGAFYVRESQLPHGGLTWESWLLFERDDERRRTGPAAPMAIRRQVVQAVRWPDEDKWSVRLSSGHIDGPYHDWAFGSDFIGKVVGIFLPTLSAEEN